MVKSPVEGSTAALIRLETPVVFSDFIRPICLPDILRTTQQPFTSSSSSSNNSIPYHDRLSTDTLSRSKKEEKVEDPTPENREFFFGPEDFKRITFDDEHTRKERAIPTDYIQETTTDFIKIQKVENRTEPPEGRSFFVEEIVQSSQKWTTCNTLGWSQQREHLQRVQLKISNMATCENISIATVNSMCTEAAFHKQDCTEEEYAGSPVMCLMPNSNRWVLVGVASWRIACAPNGIERPRMYDKITPNSAWITRTINAT